MHVIKGKKVKLLADWGDFVLLKRRRNVKINTTLCGGFLYCAVKQIQTDFKMRK